MSSSFITMDDVHGFWAHDAWSVVACWAMVNVIDHSTDPELDWMKGEYREHLYDCSQGIYVGFTNLRLEIHLTSPERKQAMLQCVDEAATLIRSKGEFLPAEELNGWQQIRETRRIFGTEVSSEWGLRYLTWLRLVINGTVTWLASDKMDYWEGIE